MEREMVSLSNACQYQCLFLREKSIRGAGSSLHNINLGCTPTVMYSCGQQAMARRLPSSTPLLRKCVRDDVYWVS